MKIFKEENMQVDVYAMQVTVKDTTYAYGCRDRRATTRSCRLEKGEIIQWALDAAHTYYSGRYNF